MKLTTFVSAPLLIAVAAADSVNVASVISDFYPVSTPKIQPAQSTSLASALYSVESTWTNSPAWTSVLAAINSAAPSSVQASLHASGFRYKQITSQPWYTKSVPHAQQTALANQISAEDSVAAKIIGTPTKTNGAAVRTGLPMVAGAMGVVAALL